MLFLIACCFINIYNSNLKTIPLNKQNHDVLNKINIHNVSFFNDIPTKVKVSNINKNYNWLNQRITEISRESEFLGIYLIISTFYYFNLYLKYFGLIAPSYSSVLDNQKNMNPLAEIEDNYKVFNEKLESLLKKFSYFANHTNIIKVNKFFIQIFHISEIAETYIILVLSNYFLLWSFFQLIKVQYYIIYYNYEDPWGLGNMYLYIVLIYAGAGYLYFQLVKKYYKNFYEGEDPLNDKNNFIDHLKELFYIKEFKKNKKKITTSEFFYDLAQIRLLLLTLFFIFIGFIFLFELFVFKKYIIYPINPDAPRVLLKVTLADKKDKKKKTKF